MTKKRPYVLSIAGFDPSGGAGVLADVKTFEKNKCLGMAVQTANTIQTEDEFQAVNWVDENVLMDQLIALTNRYSFEVAKIGLIKSIEQLKTITEHNNLSKTKIIWDPVLSASAGFDFQQDLEGLENTLAKLFLITPNADEAKKISGLDNPQEGARKLGEAVQVLLTGGHNTEAPGKDFFVDGKTERSYNPKGQNRFAKHGSGCVFSSAIAASIARGYPLHKSILRGKRYVENYLSSSPNLLGHHY